MNTFQADQFDVMIVENFDMCGVGSLFDCEIQSEVHEISAFAYLVNPKSLITSSASTPFSFMFEEFGIPLALSYNPSKIKKTSWKTKQCKLNLFPASYMSFLDVHSVFERVKNIYGEILMHALLYPGRWMVRKDALNINSQSLQIEELYRDKFGNSFPSLQARWSQQNRNIIVFLGDQFTCCIYIHKLRTIDWLRCPDPE